MPVALAGWDTAGRRSCDRQRRAASNDHPGADGPAGGPAAAAGDSGAADGPAGDSAADHRADDGAAHGPAGHCAADVASADPYASPEVRAAA